MCCSFLTQIVYGIICATAFGLTCVSMFTPGWKSVSFDSVKDALSAGIFPFACTYPGSVGATMDGTTACVNYFNNLSTSQKAVVACMIIAVALEVVAFVYNLFTCCACCCKKYLLHPLSALSCLIAVFLAIAVIIFAVNNKNDIGNVHLSSLGSDVANQSVIGYSFYMACGALALAIVNTIVAAVAIFFADHCC